DGGLGVALAESCLAAGSGCALTLPGDAFTVLFSESAARALTAVTPGAEAEFAALCAEHGVPAEEIGTTGGLALEVTGSFAIALNELAAAHRRAPGRRRYPHAPPTAWPRPPTGPGRWQGCRIARSSGRRSGCQCPRCASAGCGPGRTGAQRAPERAAARPMPGTARSARR